MNIFIVIFFYLGVVPKLITYINVYDSAIAKYVRSKGVSCSAHGSLTAGRAAGADLSLSRVRLYFTHVYFQIHQI